MKRKLIQLAGKTLVVSLPSKWAEKHGVKKGDEVDLVESGSSITISTQSIRTPESVSVDLSGADLRSARYALSGLYKKGYDEIEVSYDSPKVYRHVQEAAKELLMGFIVTEKTVSKCVLKAVSRELHSEFDSVFRKAFQVTLSMADGVLESIRSADYDGLKELDELERTNNQLTGLCERILQKHGYSDHTKNFFLYAIARDTEKICDSYRYISSFISQKRKKPGKLVLELLERTNSFLRDYYELLYNYKFEKSVQLSAEREKLIALAHAALGKDSINAVVTSYLVGLINKIAELSASTYAIRFEEKEKR